MWMYTAGSGWSDRRVRLGGTKSEMRASLFFRLLPVLPVNFLDTTGPCRGEVGKRAYCALRSSTVVAVVYQELSECLATTVDRRAIVARGRRMPYCRAGQVTRPAFETPNFFVLFPIDLSSRREIALRGCLGNFRLYHSDFVFRSSCRRRDQERYCTWAGISDIPCSHVGAKLG